MKEMNQNGDKENIVFNESKQKTPSGNGKGYNLFSSCLLVRDYEKNPL